MYLLYSCCIDIAYESILRMNDGQDDVFMLMCRYSTISRLRGHKRRLKGGTWQQLLDLLGDLASLTLQEEYLLRLSNLVGI